MNKDNKYQPCPIDTSEVILSPEIALLGEMLAQNVHEVWAEKRMAEGWRYGKNRDDREKRNPCLVPYEELPESEKEYDRATAMETLRTILSLGYQIIKEE